MSNLWDKTSDLNEKQICQLLHDQFGLAVQTITRLGEGFDNSAYLINGTTVFRFPHRQQAYTCMANEILLLPYLKKQLSFALPDLCFIGEPTLDYPYPFAGYPLLAGTLLTKHQRPLLSHLPFAMMLGTWLKALHQVPIEPTHLTKIQGDQDWRLNIPNRIEKIAQILMQYGDYFLAAGLDPTEINEVMHSFEQLHISDNETAYLHGDLYAKHILVDNTGMPCGLIDWGDSHIGHPAIDLSVGVMLFELDALQVFLEAYGSVSHELFDIAIFRALCHALGAYAYFCQIKEYPTMLWIEAAIQNALHLLKA